MAWASSRAGLGVAHVGLGFVRVGLGLQLGWIKWLAGAGLSIHPATVLLLPIWIMRVPCLYGPLSLAYSLWMGLALGWHGRRLALAWGGSHVGLGSARVGIGLQLGWLRWLIEAGLGGADLGLGLGRAG